MEVLSTETERFMRVAEVAGLELPATITEKLERIEELKAQKDAIQRPGPVPTKSHLLASGVPLDEVTEEHARLMADARNLAELYEAVANAQDTVTRQVSNLVAQEREGLMLALRPIVTALVEEARPLAESLAPFAPKYDDRTIIRHASTRQIKDWRKAEELEAKFGVCMAAWRSAMSDSERLGGTPSPSRVPDFDIRWVDQAHYYWEWPDRVLEPRLNGAWYAPNRSAPSAIRPTLLSVARERPECGFRLATLREMAKLYRTGTRHKESKMFATNPTGQTPGGGVRFDTAPVAS